MTQAHPDPTLKIRLTFADGGILGPGKADLLAYIAETGSIAAAGRRMGMSYKRAWQLVETMNAMFVAPVVLSNRGGSSHGGAQLTQTGAEVLSLFRRLETHAGAAIADDIAGIMALRAPSPAGKTKAEDEGGGSGRENSD